MRRIRIVFAVVLAALWLPATQHCGLEAAGILTSHAEQDGDSGCGADGENCAGDACETVEGGEYKLAGGMPKLSAPLLVDCLGLFGIDFESPEEIPDAIRFRAGSDRPFEWVPIWQFVQRAALPPRAPSLA